HGRLRAGRRAAAAVRPARAGGRLHAGGAGGTRTSRIRRDPRRAAAGQSPAMRRLRRSLSLRPIPVALALLLASAAAQAQAPDDELMLLDLCLNARCSGIAAVVVRDETVLVDREALLAAGLDPTALIAQQIDGRPYVDPAQLGQGIEVLLDRANLRVDLVQRAEDMPAQTVDLRTRGRRDQGTRSWTA